MPSGEGIYLLSFSIYIADSTSVLSYSTTAAFDCYVVRHATPLMSSFEYSLENIFEIQISPRANF